MANLGSYPIIVVEIWAIYYSLVLTWQKGFHHVLLKSDSSSALYLIQKESIERHPFASVIKRVRDLLTQEWVMQISHIFREANSAADFLVNFGHSIQLGVCFYDTTSNGLAPLLMHDSIGMLFSSSVS